MTMLILIGVTSLTALGDDARSHLLPKLGEQSDQASAQNRFSHNLRTCFSELRNGRYPSGYARLKLQQEQGARQVQMERSTFADPYTESCIISQGQRFRNEDASGNRWSYAHIISQCEEVKDRSRKARLECQNNVILSDFSENKEVRDIIETHWKYNSQNPYASRSVWNLIMLLNHLSRK